MLISPEGKWECHAVKNGSISFAKRLLNAALYQDYEYRGEWWLTKNDPSASQRYGHDGSLNIPGHLLGGRIACARLLR